MAPVALEDLDRRLAVLEGWKESQEQFTRSIKDEVLEVQNRITAFQQHVDHRLSDQDRAIGELRSELKGEMVELGRRVDKHTRWIVGVQFLTLLTLIAALLRLVQ